MLKRLTGENARWWGKVARSAANQSCGNEGGDSSCPQTWLDENSEWGK